MSSISFLGGVTPADFQPGEWQVFNNELFNRFRDEGVEGARISEGDRRYASYANRSKKCHLCDDSPRYLADLVSKKLYLNRAAFVRAEYGRFLIEPCLHPGFKTRHRDYKTLGEFIHK